MDVVRYGGGVDVESREDIDVDNDGVNVEASGVDVDDGSISGVGGLVVDVDFDGGVDVDDVTDDVCGCNILWKMVVMMKEMRKD